MAGAESADPADPEVVEWGGAPAEPGADVDEPRRRWPRGVRWLDRNVLLSIAALGLAATFGALVGEWYVISIPISAGEGQTNQHVTVTVAGLGALGIGYLAGALVSTACLGLVFFGGGRASREIRVLGLVGAGWQAACTLAVALNPKGFGGPFSGFFFVSEDPLSSPQYGPGRGLYAAAASAVVAGLVLYLAGQRTPLATAPAEATTVTDDSTAPAPDPSVTPEQPTHRPSTRRRRRDKEPEPAGGPIDLTVGPAAPFTAPPEER